MITAEKWYLGMWKPGTAGSNHVGEWQQLSGFLAVGMFVMFVFPSRKPLREFIHPERQNLATLRSSCFNNTELKPCRSSPGRAGCFLLILPLHCIQTFYLDNSWLSVCCALLGVVVTVMCQGKWKEQHMEWAQGQAGHSQAAVPEPDLSGGGCLSK